MSLQTFTVLIVEDLITDRELYRRILGQDSSCVYSLLEAESVAAGLALCQNRSIDAVLLDYALPDGSGLDFLERLSAQTSGHNPPVVMISGRGNEKTAVRAVKLGAEDYLVKSELTTELLLATLRSAIENTHLRSQVQQQKEQITTIWESMTDAYATLDLDWRIVYTNSAATEIFLQMSGLTPAEYLGKTHWDVFPTSMGTIVEQEYRRAVSDRVAVHFELFLKPTNTWFETHAYPSEVGLGIYFRDISQRKWLECERLAAEQERDRFFDLSIDLLVVINLDGHFVRVNPACEKILGFTSAETMAQPFIDFLHPDDIAASMAVFEGLGAANVIADFENRYRCKDESYRWILWSAILDPERKLIYANGHDITDRKIAELNAEFLYDLLQRLRKLTDPEAIQWEAVKSLGDYLKVDRAMWFDVDLERGVVTISRNWNRNDVGSMVGEYSIDEFASPTFQSTMRAGEPIAIADVMIDPLTASYSDNYQQAGVRAFASIPCLDDKGRWVITLHLNTHQNVRIWRDDEIQLMQTLVTQLWSFVAQARSMMALRAQEEKTRAAQAIVQQQLGEIESIYQMAPVGLCFVDTDLRYVRINEQLAQTNGLRVAEHIGKTFREVLPEVADLIESTYRQVVESGEPIIDLEVTGSNRAQPEVERCWLASFYPQTDDQGRVIGVNNVVQEITDRKIAAQLLQESEQQLRTGVEVAGIGLLKFDFAADQFELSSEAAILYGFARDTSVVTREQLHATFHPAERAELEAAITQALDPQGTGWIAQDHRIVWPNGDVRCLSVRAQVYFVSEASPSENRSDTVARPSYAILAAIDVTDRKRIQADLEKRNQELDSFVYIVSHDLKAPLRAVVNLSQWIEDDLEGQLTANNQSQMNLLRNRVDRMSSTIDGLLDYARCGYNNEEIELVEVARLLADVIDSVDPPPTFTIDFPAELPTLFAKRLPLFQVLVNLIGNGIKHHHSKAGTIQISIEDHGDFYEFAIADNGPGIAPEHQEQMFKIFQAVNPQNRSDSTGIGLAIVKKTIEAEGGRIWLTSELGQGTTFYFTWFQR